jgi:hypothetical protein
MIRKGSGQDVVADKESPSLLDCQILRSFWINWQGGVIRVGSGEDMAHELLVYSDAAPIRDLRHVSVATGYSNQGEWEIRQTEGSIVFKYHTFWG